MATPAGKYRHYKGKLYEVLFVAKHTETMEDLVVYRALYDTPNFGFGSLWVRPESMFNETLDIEGKLVRRFAPIDE